MSGNEEPKRSPAAIKTPEQARRYMDERLTDLETFRLQVDMEQQASEQRTLYARFLLRHGYVEGALDMLVAVGLLTSDGYDQLKRRALDTMIPSAARGITLTGGKL